ncbi:complement factor H-like isoform X2 [Betta splendens]|uniref:Complement factor H-like isoform X2 n=1 Tax=Betta splendens TaxID=158456 RepID=A0A9W2XDA2_BETSP|nr:complement factor H-like isoform X2 [Betta splendens]
MCLRHLGFVLLLWFPAELHGESDIRCAAPVLVHGLFTPKQGMYPHGAKLTYTCNNGHKPIDQGWWVMSMCKSGWWSPSPQCIDESSCVEPDVNPNTRYSPSPTGWYENGKKIQIRCDKGYETKNNVLSATCVNGDWSSMPICEKRTDSCSEPPQLPHAVIINQTHQELFAVDSEVMYQCEDGYTTEQGESMISVVCISGSWTEGPTCKQSDNGLRPVANCGNYPYVPQSTVVSSRMALKYSCPAPYELMGPETVVCNSDGSWSDLPMCKAPGQCVVDPDTHPSGLFVRADLDSRYAIVPEGQMLYFRCTAIASPPFARAVKCRNGILTVARSCCPHHLIVRDICW